MILTEETHTGVNECTMENERAASEEPYFGQAGTGNEVAQTRIAKPTGWQSNTSSSVSNLGALTHKAGPNVLLKVMAGDQLSATTQYYYQNPVTNTTGDNLTTSIVTALIQSILGSPATGLAKGNTTNISNQLSANTDFLSKTAPDANNADGSMPKAYMTIIFFDERFNFVSEGSTALRVAGSGDGQAPLVIPNVKAPKNGFAYVYLSNESNEPVYFDNFTVSDNRGRIIEEDHYYAFGLKIAGISSKKFGDPNEGMLDNKNLYNDKELFEDADLPTGQAGLDWYDYGFRSYDPQIGRFPQLDPLTYNYPHYTPYQYAGNEPIANIDLDGLEGFNSVQTLQEVVIYAGNVGKSASSLSKLSLAANVLKLSQGFINPIPRNISESSCIPCASQKMEMGATSREFENRLNPKTTIGPDNYYVSEEQKEINLQKNSDLGINPDGSDKFWVRAAKNKTFTNFSNNLALPIITAAVGEGSGKIVFKGVGYFMEGASGQELYHYTTQAAAGNISKTGLNLSKDGFVYTTTQSGLSPLQAQIELSLSPNRGLPNALFKIDGEGLRKVGINPIIGPRSVTGGNFGAGGGLEILFNKPIPVKYLIRLK